MKTRKQREEEKILFLESVKTCKQSVNDITHFGAKSCAQKLVKHIEIVGMRRLDCTDYTILLNKINAAVPEGNNEARQNLAKYLNNFRVKPYQRYCTLTMLAFLGCAIFAGVSALLFLGIAGAGALPVVIGICIAAISAGLLVIGSILSNEVYHQGRIRHYLTKVNNDFSSESPGPGNRESTAPAVP